MPPAPKTVLWVDDEAELLESHRLFLTEKGFEVEMASNAADALELLRRRAFDLMLLDEQMPGMRGVALVRYGQARSLVHLVPTLRDAIFVDSDAAMRSRRA